MESWIIVWKFSPGPTEIPHLWIFLFYLRYIFCRKFSQVYLRYIFGYDSVRMKLMLGSCVAMLSRNPFTAESKNHQTLCVLSGVVDWRWHKWRACQGHAVGTFKFATYLVLKSFQGPGNRCVAGGMRLTYVPQAWVQAYLEWKAFLARKSFLGQPWQGGHRRHYRPAVISIPWIGNELSPLAFHFQIQTWQQIQVTGIAAEQPVSGNFQLWHHDSLELFQINSMWFYNSKPWYQPNIVIRFLIQNSICWISYMISTLFTFLWFHNLHLWLHCCIFFISQLHLPSVISQNYEVALYICYHIIVV